MTDEILEILKNNDNIAIIRTTIEEVKFLRDKLKRLRNLPFIQIFKNGKQASTPASKLYKELLQQYNNCIKILLSTASSQGENEVSPLRDYFNKLQSERDS